MKKQIKFLILCIGFVCGITFFGISVTTLFLRSNTLDTVVFSNEDAVAYQNQKTKILKTETKDYYYYEIFDYERDLSYSWQFLKDPNKNVSVEDSLYIKEDLRLSIDSNTEGAGRISDKVSQKKLIISFDYHGELPLATKVKLNVGDRFQNGEHLYLYYYNPQNDGIEYIMHDVEVKNGYVEFQIEHCSDYFLTGAVVNDAVNNPQSVNYIIIGLIVIVFILIAVTLIQSKK